MGMIIDFQARGMKRKRICELIQIDERRVRQWFSRASLRDSKSGPVCAPHALLKEEQAAIIALAKDDKYVDDSHRVLTAKGIDGERIAVSASSVYRVMRASGLTTDRSGRVGRTGRSRKPDRPVLTSSNKRWCWDISYLPTLVPGIFLYLYVLLDEYSRKVIAYRISWHQTYREGMELVEEGLDKEGLEKNQVQILSLFNDRGPQMKAKAFRKMLENLGISQIFSRPRTPNDNPFIESFFSTVKCSIEYPGSFQDDLVALAYFTSFMDFYNNVRLHARIGYVTPTQRHSGKDKAILSFRAKQCNLARKNRMAINRKRIKISTRTLEGGFKGNLFATNLTVV